MELNDGRARPKKSFLKSFGRIIDLARRYAVYQVCVAALGTGAYLFFERARLLNRVEALEAVKTQNETRIATLQEMLVVERRYLEMMCNSTKSTLISSKRAWPLL
ncbi:MAG: hypothetical protein DMG06_22395 [Acidobacteria bacterium]|nr:MAG: hypothetical protein DMG06_22395 [Acidobacteriota bacterium]